MESDDKDGKDWDHYELRMERDDNYGKDYMTTTDYKLKATIRMVKTGTTTGYEWKETTMMVKTTEPLRTGNGKGRHRW